MAPRSAEAVAAQVVPADFLEASAFPVALPCLNSIAISRSRVIRSGFFYDLQVIWAGWPDHKHSLKVLRLSSDLDMKIENTTFPRLSSHGKRRLCAFGCV